MVVGAFYWFNDKFEYGCFGDRVVIVHNLVVVIKQNKIFVIEA